MTSKWKKVSIYRPVEHMMNWNYIRVIKNAPKLACKWSEIYVSVTLKLLTRNQGALYACIYLTGKFLWPQMTDSESNTM